MKHSLAENIFKEATSPDPPGHCLTHLEAATILGTGRIVLSHTAQELGVCSSKNVSLKLISVYFRSALLLHWEHRHFPPPLETDCQVGISWHSICPVHSFPSWQKLIVAGSGQTGPGGAESSLPRVHRAELGGTGGSRSSGGGSSRAAAGCRLNLRF